MLRITPFSKDQSKQWDQLVSVGRNGVFMFERLYMGYHADRFVDASIMIWDNEELIAVFPAHRAGSDVMSHGGLTFGGLVLHPKAGAQLVLEMMQSVADHLKNQGVRRLLYRPVPHIYHRQPSEEDLYALHRMGARIIRTDLSMTIDLEQRPELASRRKRAISKARRVGIEVRESDDFRAFWALLRDTLKTRYDVAPVHTEDEIELLSSRFSQIALHTAQAGEKILAGVVTYRYDRVLHTQYLATTPDGRECGALDLILANLMDHAEKDKIRWFNFGTSTFNGGRELNTGLAAQKEMFGGRGTIINTFELNL